MDAIDNERFKTLIQYLKNKRIVRNQQDFSERIDYNKATLSLILNNKIRIPENMFSSIGTAFPYINTEWLRTGQGNMLRNTPITNNATIHINNSPNSGNNSGNITTNGGSHTTTAPTATRKPLITAEIAQTPNLDKYDYIRENGTGNQFVEFSLINSHDLCWRVTQDALAPQYQPNDILFLQALPKDVTILNGSPMVIDSRSFGFIFRLLYDNGDNYELRTTNEHSTYTTTLIEKSDVMRVYRVIGMVRLGV